MVNTCKFRIFSKYFFSCLLGFHYTFYDCIYINQNKRIFYKYFSSCLLGSLGTKNTSCWSAVCETWSFCEYEVGAHRYCLLNGGGVKNCILNGVNLLNLLFIKTFHEPQQSLAPVWAQQQQGDRRIWSRWQRWAPPHSPHNQK